MFYRFTVFLLFAWVGIVILAQDSSSSTASYQSSASIAANTAFDNNDYELALSEYQRFITEMNSSGKNLNAFDEIFVSIRMGICYRNMLMYDQSIACLAHADSVHKQMTKLVDGYRCSIDEQLTLTYLSMRNLDEAERWAKLNLIHNRRYFKTESLNTANANYWLYQVYLFKGNDALAAQHLKNYLELCAKTDHLDLTDINDIKPIVILGGLYNKLNKCDEGIPLLLFADSVLCDINEHHPLRINIYNQLSTVFMGMGEIDVAREIIDEEITLANQIPDSVLDENDLLNMYNNIAVALMEMDPDLAIEIFKTMLNLYELSEKNKNTLNYALLLANISTMIEDTSESAEFSRQAIDIIKDLNNIDVVLYHMIVFTHICNLMEDKSNQQNEIVYSATILQDYLSRKLNESFLYLGENERTLYWSQIRNWYQNTLPYLAREIKTPEMRTLCYDGLLQSRGILLHSSISIEALVHQSDDPILKSIYKQMTDTKELSGSTTSSTLDALEKRLLQEIPQYGNFMDAFKVNTSRVQEHLKPGDVAIEFMIVHEGVFTDSVFIDEETGYIIDTEELNDNTDKYVALVLKPGYRAPHLVELCSENDLINDNDHDLFYKKVWQPLEEEIFGAERILFSPDGRLFALPIEYSVTPSGKCMMDQYVCNRVSSTREIAFNKAFDGNDAILYGGIRYDMTVDEMIEDAKKYRAVTFDNVRERGSRGALVGIRALPGTLTEAREIAKLINESPKSRIKAHTFCGTEATETSFKAQSGKQNRIIHIATHGFYDNNLYDSIYVAEQSNVVFAEESALSRSGLLFAGVDNVRFGEPIPQDVEDGVMDAYEISHLDLHNTDMVVLSACQTAQGVITGEGVFGLQRGFKKAGANSILMSLWKVDDEATCMLMTEFYRNWIGKGKSKHEALELAKEAVRNHPGWEDPKYWAAFILLDGLD